MTKEFHLKKNKFWFVRDKSALTFLKRSSRIGTILGLIALQSLPLAKAQELNLNLKNATLTEVLKEIRKQTGYQIIYDSDILQNKKLITYSGSKLDLRLVLKKALTEQDLDFVFEGKTIIVKPQERTGLKNIPNQKSEKIEIKGTVLNASGKPIAGVTVTERGTSNTVLTAEDGTFTLKVANEKSILDFSYVGYASLSENASRNPMLLTMASQDRALEEVVVVGYGTQKKANLTGAVSSLDGKELESRPVQNVGQALQGMIPGLNLQTTGLGGELNQNLSVNIRGAGTIGVGSSSSVLVLIDGMEGNMNALNPQDIENITVLKDAAASAIYGSRAPFGVILITTKSGKSGKITANYSNNIRLGKPRGLPTMLDSKTFAYYFNEVAANDGEGAKFSQEVLERIDAYQKGEIETTTTPNASDRFQYYTGSNGNTNWFKEFYRDFTTSHEHTLSLNGGTDKLNFYSSANYMDQNGLNRFANDNFQRYSIATKINAKINDKLDLMYNTRFVREDYEKASHMNDLYYHNIARRWPTIPLYDPNGNYSEPSEILQLQQGGRSKFQKDFLYQQLQLHYQPIKNLNITGNVNYRITSQNDHAEILRAYSNDAKGNPFSVAVGYNAAGYTNVSEYNRKDEYFSTNFFSDYSFDINDDHHFKILAGFNSELNKYRDLNGSMSDLITDNIPTLNTATTNPRASGGYQHWATAGFFGRLNYSYKDKYLFEANGRYDGSSRFPRDLRWNLFPSVSVGWNIANESFWPIKEHVSMFKLRGSYGELGNQYTDNWYPFYATMPVSIANGTWLLNGQKTNTASAPGLIASTLTWERVSSWNVGVDLRALSNRLGLSLEVYRRNTFDMIGPAPELPVILGTAVPRLNNAEMNSKGFEIELNWKDHIGKLNYSARAVLSDDRQTVTKYPNPTGTLSTWYDGRKNGEIWGYQTLGIAQSAEEMAAHLANAKQSFGTNWQAGDIMYADLNGDGQVNNGANTLANPGDLAIIGNSGPRYRYSFDLNFNYSGFDLGIFLQGVGKRDYMPNGPYFWGANGGMWQSAGFVENMDFYRDENSTMVQNGVLGVNKDSYLPRPYFNTSKNQQTQTRYLQSAAYLRLKNAQFGYTFSPQLLTKIGFTKIRIYASGENLLTFTKMAKVFDPETVGLGGWNDGKTYPFSTTYSFGLNLNF